MDGWRIAEVALLCIVAGTLLPVFFQLRSTLRKIEHVLTTAAPRLDRSLEEISAAANRIDRVGAAVEKFASSLSVAASIGAALGPAVAAAVQAFRRPPEDHDATDLHAPHPKENHSGQQTS